LGEGVIVHPLAKIFAQGGDIIIGDYTIIEENAQIRNQPRMNREGQQVRYTMRIGSYNVIECGASIDSSDIGDLNEFGVKCQVPAGCQIQNCCTIAPTMILPS
jgi:dynactin-6